MFNIDFSGLTEYLDEIQEALRAVGGNLGQVRISNVMDQQEVDRAVAEMEGIVDHAFAPYIGNPTVSGIAEEMKAAYRSKMLEQVEDKKRELNNPDEIKEH